MCVHLSVFKSEPYPGCLSFENTASLFPLRLSVLPHVHLRSFSLHNPDDRTIYEPL